MTTIKEVAAAAGVKPATVSYVMNGTGSVSAATRERVRAAAAALNYAPSFLAQSLQRRASRTFGLVLPNGPADERIGTILSGLAEGAAAIGYDLLLHAHCGDEGATYERLFRSRRIDGLVILHIQQEDERVEAARAIGLPYVCFGRPADASPFVAIDAEAGTIESFWAMSASGC